MADIENGKVKDNIDTVQVALRIRPLMQQETDRGCDECIDVVLGENQVQIKDLAFTYNYVFAQHITQQEFYDTAVKGLIGRLFQGVIPQAVADIFDFIDAHEDQFIFKISVSFMELYQEQCYDLLSGKEKGHSIIEIREDINKGVVLPGLTELAVSSTMETMLALERGSSGRVTGSIPMNQASSRSHAVFTIHITKESRTNKNIATTSKFHLVDLAGSERLKKTKASGKRLKEGVKINQGLLALGNVISALGDGTKRSFISYRDSKLTRLLQDSLGGNSLTLIVACVSPADYNLDETLSTLRYADRARRIRNKPITNQDDNAAEILRLNNLVNKLRLHLQQNNEQLDRERQRYAELEKKYQKATEHLSDMLVENTNLCEKALSAEAAKDKIERKLNELTEECNQTIGNLTASESVDDDKQKSVVGNLKEIKSRLEDLQSVSLQTNEQLIDHEIKLSTISDSENDKIDVDEDQAVIEEEKRTIRQVKINKELQELIRAMAYKASMLQVILVNNKEMLESHTNLRDIEEKIEKLEKERDELLQQLKQTKSKDPKHEERRTKVSTLEHDISELKKRNQQQANIIKIKEKNEAKRATLNAELQAMKCTKLKIIKQLREESEKVRKRKADKERAMLRLKNEDRKRATAMAKMETLHAKQQNVLKRNMEEAVAVNKRLKVRRPCFIMKKTGIPSPARSVGPPVKPRRHKPRASRSVGSPALSNASGRLSTPVQKFQEENMDSFVMSPVDIKSVLSDSTDIDLPRRKSWWKNLDDNYEDVMEVCRKNSVDEMENILDYYLDGDTLTQQKLDHIMDVLESSDSESIASIVLPQRRLFIYKDSHLANWPNIKSREAHAKLDKTEVEDKTLLVETKKLLGQKQRTVRPTFPKALITLPNRTLSNDELSDVEVKKLFRPKHTKKRSSLFSDTDHDSEKEANEPGTSGPRNLFGRHKKRTKFNFPVLDIEHSIADEEQSGVKIDKQNEKKEEEIKHIDENRSVVEDIGENEQSDEENRNQGEKSIEIDQDEENYEQEKENSEVIDQSFAEKQENEESDDQYVGDIAESGVEEDENNDQSVAKEQEDEYKKSDDQNIEDSELEMELNYEDDDMSVLEEQQSEHESDNENLEVVDDNDVVTDQSIEENEPNDHSDEQDKDEQENYEEIDHDDLKEDVEQSWKAPRQNVFNDFKFPLKPGFKPAPKKAKSKAKPSNVLLSALPPDLRKELNNKPAKRFNRVFWCTKRLYKFLETKLKPKYDNMAREHAENLVEKLYVFGKNIKKYSVASQESIKELKHEMARLKIVKTHFEFYNFFKEYMPNEMRIKVVPDRANKLPLPKDGVFVDILRESVPGPCDKLF